MEEEQNKVDNSTLPAETLEENIQSTDIETQEPSEEQKAFDKLVLGMEQLNLEKDDVVVFRNGMLGRIDAISIDKDNLMYRIYVKLADTLIVTLNEHFENMEENSNYNVDKIISKDFTNVKVEVKLDDLILTKEQAQEELTNLKGQNVIIE